MPKLIGILLLAVTSSVLAQPRFQLERPDITAIYRFELEDENEKTPSGSRSEQTRRHIGTLLIETGGWVYDPGLLEFDVAFEPEIRAETIKLPGDRDQDNSGYFLNYVVHATALQFKPYSLDLFSTKSRRQYNYAFVEDTVVDNFIVRPSLVLRFEPINLSSRITYEKRKTEITGIQDSEQNIDRIRGYFNHQIGRSKTTLVQEYVEDDQRADGRVDRVDRYRTDFINLFDISEDLGLVSSVFFNLDDPEIGLISKTEFLRWSERLDWQYSDDLRSYLRLQHYRQKASPPSRDEDPSVSPITPELPEEPPPDQRIRQWVFEGGAQHQLYENLISRGVLRADRLTSNDGDIKLYDGDFDFNYTRRIPWGNVNAFAGYFVRYEDNAREANEVINESVTLVGTQEVELAQLNIDIGSVVVTDSINQLVVYDLGTDYILTEVESGGATITLIRRTGPTSSIPDGRTVLVDYRFEPVPPYQLLRNEFSLGFGVDLWNTLRMGYSVIRNEEDLLGGTAPPDLADDWIQRAGAELRWRWSTTRLDWEDRNTVRNPTTTYRAQERLLFRFGRRWSLGAYGAYTDRTYQDLGDEQQTLAFGGNVRWQVTPRLAFDVDAYDERVRGDRQDTDRRGLRSVLDWRYGLWLARAEYRYDHYEDNQVSQTRDDHRVWVEVGRELW